MNETPKNDMSSESDVHELPPLATKKQVADWVGVSTRQIELLLKAGAFTDPIRIGARRKWRRSDLLVWLNKQETYSE